MCAISFRSFHSLITVQRMQPLIVFYMEIQEPSISQRWILSLIHIFAPLEAVEVPEIEARRDEFKAAGLDAIRAGKVHFV